MPSRQSSRADSLSSLPSQTSVIVFVEQQGAKHQEDETPRSSGRKLKVAEVADSVTTTAAPSR